jgi:hypothetical protein
MLSGGSSTDLTGMRRFGNWVFRTLTNLMTGSRYSDLCYGYFAFRRGTVDALDLRADGFEIETEINVRAHRAGLRITEVPSAEALRLHGTSQLSAFKDGLRILFTIFRTSLDGQRRFQPGASDWGGRSFRTERAQAAAVPVLVEGDETGRPDSPSTE